MNWNIYLSGEIHSDWRQKIEMGLNQADLSATLFAPVTEHTASDDCGDNLLGKEELAFWKDHKASKINSIRTRTLIEKADVVVVRFGDKFRQWNAAFDASYASALGKSIITLHDPELTHALKEVDAAALAVAQTPEQVVGVIKYVING